jgi:hypothetical protein
MAHFVTLLMVTVGDVVKFHTRETISDAGVATFGCSYFIAAHPRIKAILDEGTPLTTEMWHPIVRPHYHLPDELPAAVAILEFVEATEPAIQGDAWVLAEMHKLRDACQYGIAHGLAMVVVLSNTLSRPPSGNRG